MLALRTVIAKSVGVYIFLVEVTSGEFKSLAGFSRLVLAGATQSEPPPFLEDRVVSAASRLAVPRRMKKDFRETVDFSIFQGTINNYWIELRGFYQRS